MYSVILPVTETCNKSTSPPRQSPLMKQLSSLCLNPLTGREDELSGVLALPPTPAGLGKGWLAEGPLQGLVRQNQVTNPASLTPPVSRFCFIFHHHPRPVLLLF